MPMPTFPLARLGGFRAELHACYSRRADALFELGDALLCTPTPVASLPHLSLEPVHQRGWGSLYDALASGRIEVERLRDLLVGFLPDANPLVFAVDVTTWPRCDAECSPERGYYYHPSRHSAGQPIIAGWAWQWIAQLGFERDSWTAPVDAHRLHPLDDTDQLPHEMHTWLTECKEVKFGHGGHEFQVPSFTIKRGDQRISWYVYPLEPVGSKRYKGPWANIQIWTEDPKNQRDPGSFPLSSSTGPTCGFT
jgi:hypothetical protein